MRRARSRVVRSVRGREPPASTHAVHVLAVVTIAAGVAAALIVRYAFEDKAEGFVRPKHPALFYERRAGDGAPVTRRLLGVAHNASDCLRTAPAAGAGGAVAL